MRRRAEFERWSVLAVAGLLLLLGEGCRHKQRQTVVLPPQTPVPLVMVPEPEPDAAPMVQASEPKLPAVPVAEAASKPKKTRKRAPKASAPAAVAASVPASAQGAPPQQGGAGARQGETAASQTPAVQAVQQTPAQSEAIGALSVGGGEGNPRTQQDASELIGANARRLSAVKGDAAKTQAALLSKVRNFQKEARQALESGDAEGAKTLATKGKLLLDDLEAGEATQ